MSDVASKQTKTSVGSLILYVLLAIGVILIIKRFIFGLGSVTNLSDAYPWGFWISFDVLTGIALAAGGFTLTAGIYVWGNEKYHALARPAILTALLGYVIFVIALVIDLGRGIVMWHMFLPWMFQHHSPMFEVGWCVATYLTILIFEFLPSLLEGIKAKNLLVLWEKFTPFVVIVLLTLFTYAMTHSLIWTVIVLILTAGFEGLQMAGTIKKSRPVPILLIMAGVCLSCLHQSSLGSLFLITHVKLHPLWKSDLLPVMFLMSAIVVGPAMVIFEGIVSAKIFKRKSELELLSGLAKVLPILIIIYLIMRLGTIVIGGKLAAAFAMDTQSLMFLLELAIGSIIPLILFLSKATARSETGLFWGSLCVVLGIFLHRLNVSLVGLDPRSWQTYVPAVQEILISLGVISLGLLIFRYIVKKFPIYEEEHATG
jgi:Ni/Fe-hydrogenase subunit HybB-like protein